MSETKKKVAIIGSENWGSAIAKIIGINVTKFPYFDREVRMYVEEDMINGIKLSEIINTQHENVKYLAGHRIPETVIAIPDLLNTAKNADILVFVVPNAFVERICNRLKGKIKSTAIAISLIKGFGETADSGGIQLISEVIKNSLGIDCAVLMGANLASEVADEIFCENTIGCKCETNGKILRDLFKTNNFRVNLVKDTNSVEICGALKNIIACAVSFANVYGLGNNNKASVIRIGIKEMIRFCKTFYANGVKDNTFFESCGVADLLNACYVGSDSEQRFNGQKLKVYQTCKEVIAMIKTRGLEDRFPLFCAVYLIIRNTDFVPQKFLDFLSKEPID